MHLVSVDMCSYCHWLYLDLNQLFTAAEVQKSIEGCSDMCTPITYCYLTLVFRMYFYPQISPRALAQVCPGVGMPRCSHTTACMI